jgi:hypothetical protein
MRGLFRSVISGILIFAVVLAAWKLFGGDVGGFFAAIWSFLYAIIDGVANVFIEIFRLFGFGG